MSAHVNSTFGPTDLPGESARQHQTGQWPIAAPVDLSTTEPDPWEALQAERAERIIILGRIRAHLEDQPNPRAVRAAARRWGRYIAATGEDVITTMDESARADS